MKSPTSFWNCKRRKISRFLFLMLTFALSIIKGQHCNYHRALIKKINDCWFVVCLLFIGFFVLGPHISVKTFSSYGFIVWPVHCNVLYNTYSVQCYNHYHYYVKKWKMNRVLEIVEKGNISGIYVIVRDRQRPIARGMAFTQQPSTRLALFFITGPAAGIQKWRTTNLICLICGGF